MQDDVIKVLFVGDDDDDYVIVRDCLSNIKNVKYDLEWKSNFASACECIKEARHDVYLFDYCLGKYSGLELLKEAVSNDRRIPVILITGIDDYEVDMEAMRCGAYDYLVKNDLNSAILERSIRYAMQRKKMEEAEEANQVKNEFIANMSHELRTPLNVMLSAIQLFDFYLKEDYITNVDRLRKHMKPMKQNCFRLLRLVNNLIDTTRIDAGFFDLHLKNNNIVDIIKEITLSVSEYVKQKNINLTFCTDISERIIACDVDMIERIMLNLLSNSIKFTEVGGLIEVRLQNNSDNIIISVKDDGRGIPRDKLDIIFERYRQAEKLFTREHEGSGIGLSLIKSLIEMHGGKVTVNSEYGKGSEFLIVLPAVFIESENNKNENHSFMSRSHKLIEKMNVEFSDIYK